MKGQRDHGEFLSTDVRGDSGQASENVLEVAYIMWVRQAWLKAVVLGEMTSLRALFKKERRERQTTECLSTIAAFG